MQEPATTVLSYRVPSTGRRKLIGLALLAPLALTITSWVPASSHMLAKGYGPLEIIGHILIEYGFCFRWPSYRREGMMR